MYGVIKAHKPNKQYPMQSIVSTVCTAFHGTSKHLVKLIHPILAQNEHSLKNSTSFVSKASTWNLSPDEIQVSYDVVALYPSVPTSKAINVMIDMHNRNFDMISCNSKLTISDIRILIELCLIKCYFVWDNTMFKVPDLGPIGLSLMVIVSEAFLQFVKKNTIQQSLNKQCVPIYEICGWTHIPDSNPFKMPTTFSKYWTSRMNVFNTQWRWRMTRNK